MVYMLHMTLIPDAMCSFGCHAAEPGACQWRAASDCPAMHLRRCISSAGSGCTHRQVAAPYGWWSHAAPWLWLDVFVCAEYLACISSMETGVHTSNGMLALQHLAYCTTSLTQKWTNEHWPPSAMQARYMAYLPFRMHASTLMPPPSSKHVAILRCICTHHRPRASDVLRLLR